MERVAQFARIESYGLTQTKAKGRGGFANRAGKTSVQGACGEISRIERFTPHLKKPIEKDLIYGIEPWELQKLIYATAKKQEKEADKVGQRKPRKDRLVLTAGTFSYPHKEVGGDFYDWQADCVSYLKEKYGDNLKSVVAHYDEAFPHLHFTLCNTITLSILGLDPAKTAQHAFRTLGDTTAPKQADALRAWQDEFHVAVSNKYGHERKFGTRERIHGTPKAVRKILDDIGAQNLLLKERELAVNELAQQNNAVLNQLQLTKFKIDDGLIRNDKKAEKLDEKRKELKLMEEQLKKMLATADEEIARLQKDKRQFINEDNIDEAHKLHKQIESSEAEFKKIRQSIGPRI